MLLALLNDTHAGIRNSSEIFLNNAADFYKHIFFPYCDKNNIKQIIHLGDYYDNRKNINIRALNHNRKNFLDPMKARGIKMDIIPGNHDVTYKNTNNVNSLKEVLGHFMNEIHIIMKPSVLKYGNMNIGLVPWINKENEQESFNFISKCDADILCGHFSISGAPLLRGIINKHGMDPKIFSRFDLVLSGHFHTKSQLSNIHYLGSQMEFFWSDAHDEKYFHVLDTETGKLKAIYNPYTLFEKIEYDDTKTDYAKFNVKNLDNKFVKVVVMEKKNSFLFDKFIDRIQNQKIHSLKIAENFSEFLGENVEDENIMIDNTIDLLNSYIDAVETNLDRNKIKKLMSQLLKQAQTLEFS